MPYHEVSGIMLHVFQDGGQLPCFVHLILIDYLLIKWNGKNLWYYHWTLTNKVLIRSNVRIFNLEQPKKVRKAEKFWQLFGNFLKKIATFWQLLDTFIDTFFGIHRQLVAKPMALCMAHTRICQIRECPPPPGAECVLTRRRSPYWSPPFRLRLTLHVNVLYKNNGI